MPKPKANPQLPTKEELIIPTVKALQQLGNSGTTDEINKKVYEIANISEEVLRLPHKGANRASSAVVYILGWTRHYLKKLGYITRSPNGIWSLEKPDLNADLLNPTEIRRTLEGKC